MHEADRHEFGGPWTEVKLDAIGEYSKFFTVALRNQDFELWYIDAFAGTGSRTAKHETGGLLEGGPIGVREEILAGSARRAIEVQPIFHHLVLMDRRPSHYRALCALAAEHPSRDIRVLKGDANDKIHEVISAPPWRSHPRAWAQRALVFLDPYGMTVRWPTLEALAATKRADVWYLVNLKGVVQQLAHDHAALDEVKRRSLSEFFGTPKWEGEFYKFSEGNSDLFSAMCPERGQRAATKEDVAGYYRQRLGTLFGYVSTPLSLRVKAQDDYFQLYCMSNNESEKARALIARGAEAVIAKHAKASRHKSDR